MQRVPPRVERVERPCNAALAIVRRIRDVPISATSVAVPKTDFLMLNAAKVSKRRAVIQRAA